MIAKRYIWTNSEILYMVTFERKHLLFSLSLLGEEQFDPEEEMMRIMACDDNKHEVI